MVDLGVTICFCNSLIISIICMSFYHKNCHYDVEIYRFIKNIYILASLPLHIAHVFLDFFMITRRILAR